ncbi:Phosphoenolpyruvate/pyruvate domain-containing protein, partial [Meira miltonrushii]
QKRLFHSTTIRKSAWPLGRDASPSSTTKERAAAEAEKAYSSNNVDKNSLPPGERAITVRDLQELKERRESIAMLTAYDYPSALGIRSGAVDICLVGDSLTNVALGHRTTHPLSLEAMIHHVQAVVRGLRHPMLNQHGVSPVPLLIADVPMGYAEISLEEGSRAAVNLIKQGGADGVKMEGGMELVPLVERLASFGIPVMAHIGLQPQRSSSGSALNLAGRTADEAFELLQTAIMMQEAGAFACLLECIPARVGEEITKRLDIPTIGIGAGPKTDGQVLVMDDVLGECNSPLYVLAGLEGANDGAAPNVAPPKSALNTPGLPRFVRNFVSPLTGGSSVGSIRMAAVRSYVDAVKEGSFPAEAESYKMKKEEWAKFKEL